MGLGKTAYGFRYGLEGRALPSARAYRSTLGQNQHPLRGISCFGKFAGKVELAPDKTLNFC